MSRDFYPLTVLDAQEEIGGMAKTIMFDVPENYFSQLPDDILKQIDFPKNKVAEETISSSSTNSWWGQLTEHLIIFLQPKIAFGFAMAIVK